MHCFDSFLFLLFFVISVHVQGDCDNINPRPFIGGNTFSEPPVLSSENGLLDMTLTVEMAMVQFEWLCLHRRTFNGKIPGPTWRIRPGDTVRVKVINTLTETSMDNRPMNVFRFPNVTNIHTHGLHVSSKDPQDNVFVNIEEEREHQYIYDVIESNEPGTFWYHAHLHGSTMFQVQSGLAGVIIIEDHTTGPMAMPQHLADISCPDNCEHDHSFLFQPILNYIEGFAELQKEMQDDPIFRSEEMTSTGMLLSDWLSDPINGIDYFTTNGILLPRFPLNTGQRKRFRLINTSGDKVLELLITNQNERTPTDGCEIYEIAYDGIYLKEARAPRLGKSFLVPASRVDWIVVCNEPGIYELRSVPDPLDTCSTGEITRYEGLLVTINVTGDSMTPTTPDMSVPETPTTSSDFRLLSSSEVVSGFTLEASSNINLNREHLKSGTYFRYKLEVGTVQEWFLTNTDKNKSHPIHIHVNNFQIISYNDYTGPVSFSVENTSRAVFYSQVGVRCTQQSEGSEPGDTAEFSLPRANDNGPCKPGELVNHKERSMRGGLGTIGYVEPGDFRDVVLVPPLSNITIRFLAHELTGVVVIHCHLLEHEDFGMMMTVEIVNKGEDLTANIASGGAIPGKCFDDYVQWIPVEESSSGSLLQINSLMLLLPSATYATRLF